MTYYIINLRVLCIGKNNYLFGSAPPYEFFLIVCVCVWVQCVGKVCWISVGGGVAPIYQGTACQFD
jgi:hypothetical protein